MYYNKAMRINKFLATSGLASRRKVEEYVLAGRVSVNGQVVKELGTDVSEKDVVTVDGKKVYLPTTKLYFVVNKPVGYVTTAHDPFERKTVMDLIPNSFGRVFPIGRLDFNTTGMLLFTNDGNFANSIMHPSKEITKKYEATLAKELKREDIAKIEAGIEIDGRKTAPSKVQKLKPLGEERARAIITIHEGRNREVRKLFEAVGNRVVTLKRIQIGKLELGDLPVGKYRKLTKEDIKLIFQ